MNRTRAYCVIILSLTLLLGSALPASAVTSADLAAHEQAAELARQQAAAATALANQLKSETRTLDDQIDSLQADANALDPQIAEATARTNTLEAEVAKLRSEIASKTAGIESAQKQYKQEQELLAQRVQATYRQGNWFYLEVLLSSSNIRDLIAHTELVVRVMRSNSDAAAQLAATKTSLESAKSELNNALNEISVKRDEARTAQTTLQDLKNTRQSKVDQQATVLSQKSSLLAQTQQNAARLIALAQAEEAESARIAAELAGNGSGQFAGVMAWPTPGFYTITSTYGWRVHPITKVNQLHAGIDIAANSGASIVAAATGTVISASYLSGYGNTIMIDHGNGVVTLYAHQLTGGFRVSVGQVVAKGQRIGTVGSTGNSTGPHLHFEVRINGNPVNPMGYLQ